MYTTVKVRILEIKNKYNIKKNSMFGLWDFLVIAVVTGAIVNIYKIKNNK